MATDHNFGSATGSTAPPPRRRSGLKFAVIALLAVAVVAAALIVVRSHKPAAGVEGGGHPGPGQGKGKQGDRAPVPAVLGVVAQKDFPIYLDGLGTVQAFNTVTVNSRVDGQLQKLAFEEGQDVKAGQLLAQIDPAPYKAQVEQTEARKAQDQAQLENAKIELKRDADLLAGKVLAQEVYDTQKFLVYQFEAAVKTDQAAIDSARVQLAYTSITAPISGRTGIRQVDEGNIIRSGESNGIVVLTQLKPIYLIFTLPEQSLRDIQQQQAEHAMTVLALDRDNRTTLDEGKLSVIDNQIDTTTGTIRIKATFPNEHLKLWPGQFVNARLLLSVRTNAVVVPASVVQRGPEGAYAFVVNEDNSVKMAPVKVARMDQGQALIDEGLAPGEHVVVDGQFKLQPGSFVKPAQPVTPPPTRTNATAEKGTRSGTERKSGGPS
jgi:multidrug efflux system membrane fusion protein